MLAKNKKMLKRVGYGSLALIFILGLWYWGATSLSGLQDEEETPVLSTFGLSSSVDGEDVSNLEYIEIYLATSTATFDDWEDIRNIAGNFDMESRKLAEDINIDLSGEDYVWLKFCPSGYGSEVFSEDWELLINPSNMLREYFVSDDPTDLNFNIIDSDINEITVANHQTDGNYTIICDVPHYTTTAAQLHVGTGWAMSDSDFAELTATQQLIYYDEAHWTSYKPLYDPNSDEMTVWPRYDIEFFTDCPAFKFTFNDSAGSVNFTLADNVNAVTIADGVYLYVVFHEAIEFTTGIQSFAYEIEYPDTVELSDVDFGRATIPKGASTAPTSFTKVSDIAA